MGLKDRKNLRQAEVLKYYSFIEAGGGVIVGGVLGADGAMGADFFDLSNGRFTAK